MQRGTAYADGKLTLLRKQRAYRQRIAERERADARIEQGRDRRKDGKAAEKTTAASISSLRESANAFAGVGSPAKRTDACICADRACCSDAEFN